MTAVSGIHPTTSPLPKDKLSEADASGRGGGIHYITESWPLVVVDLVCCESSLPPTILGSRRL